MNQLTTWPGDTHPRASDTRSAVTVMFIEALGFSLIILGKAIASYPSIPPA